MTNKATGYFLIPKLFYCILLVIYVGDLHKTSNTPRLFIICAYMCFSELTVLMIISYPMCNYMLHEAESQ